MTTKHGDMLAPIFSLLQFVCRSRFEDYFFLEFFFLSNLNEMRRHPSIRLLNRSIPFFNSLQFFFRNWRTEGDVLAWMLQLIPYKTKLVSKINFSLSFWWIFPYFSNVSLSSTLYSLFENLWAKTETSEQLRETAKYTQYFCEDNKFEYFA